MESKLEITSETECKKARHKKVFSLTCEENNANRINSNRQIENRKEIEKWQLNVIEFERFQIENTNKNILERKTKLNCEL